MNVREGTWNVLSGLLRNDPILQPQRHPVDTGGYTEHRLALLGIEFMPRLKDLADDAWLRGAVDCDRIREPWDPRVRLAVALKSRIAPAEVVVQRLASAARLTAGRRR